MPWKLVSLGERGIAEADLETGSSFEENATLKAQGYASMSRLTTLVDDSGLAVDALGGRPGIYSARYGGRTTDQERIELLLSELQR
ncbi:MAG: non-canonical purine NTP pyrophosphatase, partial [Dehalococcoidia bacterium]|nr:non-canonical purine NTP pyrophosphatase [Dehalococcoidia bacterium]